jgi:hypothetical protein
MIPQYSVLKSASGLKCRLCEPANNESRPCTFLAIVCLSVLDLRDDQNARERSPVQAWTVVVAIRPLSPKRYCDRGLSTVLKAARLAMPRGRERGDVDPGDRSRADLV